MLPFKKKMLSLSTLCDVVQAHRREQKRIVLCHGTFDLLHPGHLRYFQEAKTLGDILIVTLTADQFVNKGPGRPVFSQELRAESIASLEYVDYVAINNQADAIQLLETIKPDLYVKGSDYIDHSKDPTGKIGKEVAAVRRGGGEIHYTSGIRFSSSQLLKNYFEGKE